MEGKEKPMEEIHFVGKEEELIEAKRSFRTIGDRDILIIYQKETFYAIDSYCHHAGSLLQNGDIEDIDGRWCIICPKHKYTISLNNGESLLKIINKREDPPVTTWFSRGVKQRVHNVRVINGEVYVEISKDPGRLESDFFQGEKGKVERAKAQADKNKDT
ncbi:Rieske domain-containing protein [Gouania willdenowi]|uniref:Rieske domain-containing protein n=1 Tax=Gouania willdenowi TaxID=441366 RepID=A0A8C5I3Q8_GOUWI|nr:Rieske domain-containing protein [Gouania willdenowi]XP_028303375.1 Rieske domain-containing protein [Gouania willdenowi]